MAAPEDADQPEALPPRDGPCLHDLDPVALARLVPLVVDGEIAGLLTVALDRMPGEARRRAIETVAAQAALAIETADLTESLHARAGEERFRSLVQNASDVIAVVEPGGIIRFVTRSITRMLGYEPKVPLEEGLARTCAWYRAHGYL